MNEYVPVEYIIRVYVKMFLRWTESIEFLLWQCLLENGVQNVLRSMYRIHAHTCSKNLVVVLYCNNKKLHIFDMFLSFVSRMRARQSSWAPT